jgi:hypothetical protein
MAIRCESWKSVLNNGGEGRNLLPYRSMLKSVKNQVWYQVEDQVWDQVRDQVWSQVRDQVGIQVRVQVRVQVGVQVSSIKSGIKSGFM